MDMQEVPEFKLARVGKERKRRKGGGLLPRGGGATGEGSFFSNALEGGSSALGRGGSMAALGAKIAMVFMVGALGVAAYGIGQSLRPRTDMPSKPKLFASDKSKASYSGDASNLPTENLQGQSGLNMIAGSLDGKTPEQRAAEAAAAEAAAKAEADKQAKAVEQTPDAKAQNGIDANALANSALGAGGEGKKGTFASRFGSLSNAFGGGSHSSLAGGTGLWTGVGRSFDEGKGGKLGSFGAAPSKVGRVAARASAGGGTGRGLAQRQLNNAYGRSFAAMNSGSAEGAATTAQQAFNNGPGGGSRLLGTGDGPGSSPITGPTDHNPGSNPGGGGSGPIDQPTPSNPVDACAQNANNCGPAAVGHDATPWGGLVKMATMMLMLASMLILAAWLLHKFGIIGHALAMGLAIMAAVVAGIATMIGIAIIGMGQHLQGAILTAAGGITTALAVMMAMSMSKPDVIHVAQEAARPSTNAAMAEMAPPNVTFPPSEFPAGILNTQPAMPVAGFPAAPEPLG